MRKIFLSLAVLSIVVLISCGKIKKEKANDLPAIAVKIGRSTEATHGPYITSSGKIEAKNSAEISTRIMGYVTRLYVKAGQKVHAGQLLVSINNTDLQAKKAQADAAVLQATSGYENAKKDYDRFVILFNQQSASQKELDDMTAQYQTAKAGLEGAQQMRNEITAQFSYSNVTAPFHGEIANTYVKEGDMANPGMPLLSMEGASHFQVAAMISENDIASIKEGMDANVLIKSTHQELMGKVSEVSISAKNTGGQYLVKVDLNKPVANVLSGMFVNVQFLIADKSALFTPPSGNVLVPQNALIRQGQLTGIYTLGTGNVAILRWLRLGKTFNNQVEVLSGLSADEPYILSADGKLFNGAKVSVQ